jgi:hypothetical protein
MAPGDKCTEELKTRVSEQMRDDLMRAAFAADRSPSEYVRWVLGLHLYGHVRSLPPAPLQGRGPNVPSSGARSRGER